MILFYDYTRMTWVTFFKEKLEALDRFNIFKSMVENEMDTRVKCLRSGRGGDFRSNEFVRFCEENGIKRRVSTPRTLQQNGIAKRKNMSVQEMARIIY